MNLKNNIKRLVSWVLFFTMILQTISPFLSLKSYSVEYPEYLANSDYLSAEVLKDEEGKAVINGDKIAWKIIINKGMMHLNEQEIVLRLSDNLMLDGLDQEGNVDLQKASEPFEKEELESKVYPGGDEISIDESSEIPVYTRQIEGIKYYPQENSNIQQYKIEISETENTQSFILNTTITDPAATDFSIHLIGNQGEEFHGSESMKIQSRQKTTIPVQILWQGDEEEIPDQKIYLKREEKIIEERVVLSGTTLSEFEDHYVFDIDGNEIKYTIQADTPEGYTTEIQDYSIINKFSKIPVEEKTQQEINPEKLEEKSDKDLGFEESALEGTSNNEETEVQEENNPVFIQSNSNSELTDIPADNNDVKQNVDTSITESNKEVLLEANETSDDEFEKQLEIKEDVFPETKEEALNLLPKEELPSLEETDLKEYLLTGSVQLKEDHKTTQLESTIKTSPITQTIIEEEVIPNLLYDLVEKGTEATVTIVVKDLSDKPVEGAFFELINKDDPTLVYAVGPSDDKGWITKGLPYGNYFIKQTATGEEFTVNNVIPDIEVIDKSTQITILNESKALSKVFIQTVSKDGEQLNGGEYKLTNLLDPSKTIKAETATPQGLMTEVPLGKYKVTQLTAPLGYESEKEIPDLVVNGTKEGIVIENELSQYASITAEEVEDPSLELQGLDTPLFRSILAETTALSNRLAVNAATNNYETGLKGFTNGFYNVTANQNGDTVDWTIRVGESLGALTLTQMAAEFTIPEGHVLVGEVTKSLRDVQSGLDRNSNIETLEEGNRYRVSSERRMSAAGHVELYVWFQTRRTDPTLATGELHFTASVGSNKQNDKLTVNYTVASIPKGTLNINLTDGTNPIEGQFSITDSSGELIGNFNTVNGKITESLPTGTYEIKQINNLSADFRADPNLTRRVTIIENAVVTENFINQRIRYAPISVQLRNPDNQPIQDALFYLYDNFGSQIAQGRTDSNGDLTFRSSNGGFEAGKTYKISQSTYPNKYLPDSPANGEYTISSLPLNGITANFTNKLSGVHIPVNILNPDGSSYNLPSGDTIVLRLIDAFGNIVETKSLTGPLISANTSFENMKPGNYRVTMFSISDGSKTPADEQRVEVTPISSNPSPVNMTLKLAATNNVVFQFVDEDGAPIEIKDIGLMIGTKNEDGHTDYFFDAESGSQILYTDSNGSYNTTNLETLLSTGQTYEIVAAAVQPDEISNVYHLFEEFSYTVKGDTDETVVITLVRKTPETSTNSRVKVQLFETGTNSTLAGGRFVLENTNIVNENGSMTYIGTTDADGEIYFNSLPPGEYSLRQVSSPDGYTHEESLKTLIIPTAGSSVATYNFYNNPIAPVLDTVLEMINPVYSVDNDGEYSVPFHQTNGADPDPTALYRNRDNKEDGRVDGSDYTIPAYSRYRGLGADITVDHDVIEDEKAYLWKYATPTGTPGEYFIDLVVEGKKHEPPPTKDIILVLDNSASMATARDGIQRITKLNEAVTQFINNVDYSNVSIGMVNYASDIINDQPLTKDQNSLLSKIPTEAQDGSYGGPGGTFTQKALLRAEELLRTSTAQEKVIILVSDGAPTFSYAINNLGTTTDPLTTEVYGNVSKIEGSKNLIGTGISTYQYTENMEEYQYSEDANKSYLTLSDGLVVEEIAENNTATVSEALSIKNLGIDIFAIGVELDVKPGSQSNTLYYPNGETVNGSSYVIKAESEANLKKISSGDGYYYDVDNADELAAALLDLIPRDKTIVNGKVTDPMGEQIILSNKNNFAQTSYLDTNLVNGDYFIEASDPDLLFNQGQPIVPSLDQASNTITIDGLNLGYEEWVKIRYRINLRTEDPNFKEQFYLTNSKDTLLQPERTNQETYPFGVPAIKLPLIDIRINKQWEGYNPVPTEAVFTLLRRVDGGEWETVQENIVVNEQNQWSVTLGEQIRYNNSGQEYEYQVVETAPKVDPIIEVVETEEALTFNVTNKAEKGHLYVYKTNEFGDAMPSEAKFGLYQEDKTTLIKEVTVDDIGIAKFEYLDNGVYYLKETAAPPGYILNNEWIKITVQGQQVTIDSTGASDLWYGIKNSITDYQTQEFTPAEISLKNEPIPSKLQIYKIDNNENTIAQENITFKIYSQDQYSVANGVVRIIEEEKEYPIDTITTTIDGIATSIFNYPAGQYAIIEENTPDGYVGLLSPIEIKLEFIDGHAVWSVIEGHENFANVRMVDNETIAFNVINHQVTYPATGGIGSGIFAVGGFLLMAAAYILDIRNKRLLKK